MKITYRKILRKADDNDTWLAPYAYSDTIVKVKHYVSGKLKLYFHGEDYESESGKIYIASNGWEYTTLKLLSRPISNGAKLYKLQETNKL